MKKVVLLAGLLLCGLLVAGPAMAAAPFILIDDGHDAPGVMAAAQGGFQNSVGGSLPSVVPGVTQETLTTEGHVDFDGWYNLTSGALGVGQSVTYSFNVYDPVSEGGALSDTWQLIFTGEDPAADGGNNMRVLAPFFSDSLAENGTISGPLTDGTVVNITETGHLQYLTTTGYSTTAATIYGAQFGFTSDVETAVPEPATLLLLGFGLVGLVGAGRKFKK